jgi:uncharacterized protein YdcH (DUF465 family)
VTHTPHELAAKFPHKKDQIHELKLSNEHFAHLADEYHTVNREIHRIEVEVEAASDARLEDLKKKRISLLDELSTFLND